MYKFPNGQDAYADLQQQTNLLIELVERQRGKPITRDSEWMNDIQGISKKFVMHLWTIQQLSSGQIVAVGQMKLHEFDYSSTALVVRALLENFLVMAWVFGSEEVEISRLRNMLWRRSGTMDRQRRVANSASMQAKVDEEKKQIEIDQKEIESHPAFAALPPKRRAALLKDWRADTSWHMIAREAGLHDQYFKNLYSFLSDHAHTSYGGMFQAAQADRKTQIEMMRMLLGVANVTCSHFIRVYAKQANALDLLKSHKEQPAWSRWLLGTEELDRVYKPDSPQTAQ